MEKLESVFSRVESGVRTYCRSFPEVFDKAEGSVLWSESGGRYIDFFAGAGALNYGHNNSQLKEALIGYLSGSSICHGLDLYTKAKQEFLEVFERVILKPRDMKHKVMFCGPTGTNAVESAMKVARLATGRERIAAFTNGFHGMTLGALSATGNRYHRSGAGSSLASVDRYPFDGYMNEDSVDYIRKLLNDPSSGYEPPAAFLIESIQAEGGINVASKEWLEKLGKLAKDVGSLLILDDIQVGCGRTGSFFSVDSIDISPDIICLSKSISGYGLPMALVLMKPEYDVFSPGQHNGTFRGNNLAFVTAKEAITFWEDESFSQEVMRKSAIVNDSLQQLQKTFGSDFSVRGKGMIQGLVTPSGEFAGTVSAEAFKRGLILETCGAYDHVVKLLPAINIPEDILQEGLEILNQSMLAAIGSCEHQVVA